MARSHLTTPDFNRTVRTIIPYRHNSHTVRLKSSLGYFVFARRYLRNSYWFIFLLVLKCFTSLGTLSNIECLNSGSRPESFLIRKFSDQRLLGTSPKHIATTPRPSSLHRSQGIHHMLLNFLLGNLKTTIICLQLTTYLIHTYPKKPSLICTSQSITFISRLTPS